MSELQYMTNQRKVREGYLWILFFLVIVTACTKQTGMTDYRQALVDSYRKDFSITISYLDSLAKTQKTDSLRYFYKKARLQFKRIEPILAATDKENYQYLNGPNLLKVSEEDLTDIKVDNPAGFQVLEEYLFESDDIDLSALQQVLKKTRNRLFFLQENISIQMEPRHILWLLRDACIRIGTMGITGFDSPMLLNSLEESRVVYNRLEEILDYCKDNFKDQALYEKWKEELNKSRQNLQGDFDTFDRYAFLKNHTHKQMALWTQTVKDWGVRYDFEMAIKHDATSLFAANTFNLDYYADYHDNPYSLKKAALGKRLFHDKRLAKHQDMSCATCHEPEIAFTDGQKIFPRQKRNTPTLTYSALQKGFFYDKRAGSLEGQIVSVVKNENEFHGDLEDLEKLVLEDPTYRQAFDSLYGQATEGNVRNAIATYIRQLNPFDSKFDKNINDEEETLTKEEILGFNLFMGKAACATCHFPPIFNGTVPPNFSITEMESLGVPKNATGNLVIDTDLGRYDLFHTPERKYFFKTPTIRNIALTAPYMHNGVYQTLDEVMDFYNNGGGLGMGIDVPYQTLPPDSLQLSEYEIKAIIAFMHTLTDK